MKKVVLVELHQMVSKKFKLSRRLGLGLLTSALKFFLSQKKAFSLQSKKVIKWNRFPLKINVVSMNYILFFVYFIFSCHFDIKKLKVKTC